MRRPGSSIQALSRFASSLLRSLGIIHAHIARWLRRDGVCMQHRRAKRDKRKKKRQQLGRCQRAHIPNQEPSAHQQQVKETRVRAARSVPTSMLHRGTPDESAAPPLPANQTQTIACSLYPRSTAAGPFLTTPASSLFDPCSHKSCLKHLSLASEGLVRVSYRRPHVLWVV
jgi:hypothetical protein